MNSNHTKLGLVLKPCPCCGGEATLEPDDFAQPFVECLDCGLRTRSFIDGYDSFAVDAWNKRTE